MSFLQGGQLGDPLVQRFCFVFLDTCERAWAVCCERPPSALLPHLGHLSSVIISTEPFASDLAEILVFTEHPIFGTKNQQLAVLVQQLVWGVLIGIALYSLIRSQSLNRDVHWCHSDGVGVV